MALISCPECGREISDKVTSCPHCGYPIIEEQTDDTLEAPKAQPVEVTAISIGSPKKRKKVISIIVIAVLVIVIAIIAYTVYQAQKKAAEEAAAIAAHDLYVDNLELAKATMLIGAIDAERLITLTHDVWYNTIYEEKDSRTDKYTITPYNTFYDDFNNSLDNLSSSEETKSSKEDIRNSFNSVKDIMKNLQNPTEELKECYATVSDLYTAYSGLVDLAIEPRGSLTSYTESYRNYEGNFLNAYDKLETQIPDKIAPATSEPSSKPN